MTLARKRSSSPGHSLCELLTTIYVCEPSTQCRPSFNDEGVYLSCCLRMQAWCVVSFVGDITRVVVVCSLDFRTRCQSGVRWRFGVVGRRQSSSSASHVDRRMFARLLSEPQCLHVSTQGRQHKALCTAKVLPNQNFTCILPFGNRQRKIQRAWFTIMWQTTEKKQKTTGRSEQNMRELRWIYKHFLVPAATETYTNPLHLS